jgi:uncharacterized protein
MTGQLQRPLVVGGIGLTLGLWGLDSMFHSLSSLGDLLPLGAIAVGGSYWWYNSRQGNPVSVKPPIVEIDRATLDRSVHQVELVIDRLKIESPESPQIDRLRQNLTQAKQHLTRIERQIAITGGQRVGKTSLMKLLTTAPVPCATPLKYIETPALFTVGTESEAAQSAAETIALDADLAIFVTNGDLTATEYKYITTLHRSHQRVILLFNQADRYLPDERNTILQKLQSTVAGTLKPQDVTIASTAPAPIRVRHIHADGTASEQSEIQPVEIASFTDRLTTLLATESEKLVWATTYRQIGVVHTAAKAELNTVRRNLALPSIEQNQWIVAAAALANPVPALDLLATAAVNAQMVIDLGAIYQQKFSLDRAQTAASAMGEVMLKLGLVEICTQTVAGLLKTNAATYVAGGLVQGLSAAYLTRIAGLTLIEYFEAQDLLAPEAAKAWNLDLLGTTLQKVFQANQRVAYLQTMFQQGIDRLAPESLKQSV